MPIRGVQGSSPECRAKPGAAQIAGIFLLVNQWVKWLSLARVTGAEINSHFQ